MSIEIVVGDLTKMQVDAIVNAANSSLLGGGGVDAAIHRAGGPEILLECKKIRAAEWPDGLPTGKAVVTGAGNLPCRYVIHTVGPVWHGGTQSEDILLADAYRNSVETAAALGLKTMAFPAISTGIYGYPPEKAAQVVWNTLTETMKKHELPKKIFLVFFNAASMETFRLNKPATCQDSAEIP